MCTGLKTERGRGIKLIQSGVLHLHVLNRKKADWRTKQSNIFISLFAAPSLSSYRPGWGCDPAVFLSCNIEKSGHRASSAGGHGFLNPTEGIQIVQQLRHPFSYLPAAQL